MTITLELPQELERELADEAARQGLPLAEYALRVLAMARPARAMPSTGAELVSYWHSEGLIGDSQSHARRLREAAEHRHWE